MEDAPTKLKVSVSVSDDDWQKIQGHHTQWLGEEKQMLVDQHKHKIKHDNMLLRRILYSSFLKI